MHHKNTGPAKLIYCLTVLPSPDEKYLKEVNILFYQFIAGSKTEKLKRNTLIGDYAEGGFNMIDVFEQNNALKVSWLKRFIKNAGMWREIVM